MILVHVPTRIIPGCLLGGVFAAVGMFNSAAVSFSFAQHRCLFIGILGWPFLAYAVWFIAHVWRRRSGAAEASRAAGLSPRLLAVILTVSLVIGLVTGGMAGSLASR